MRVLLIGDDLLADLVEAVAPVYCNPLGEDPWSFDPALPALSADSTYGSNTNRSPSNRSDWRSATTSVICRRAVVRLPSTTTKQSISLCRSASPSDASKDDDPKEVVDVVGVGGRGLTRSTNARIGAWNSD